MSVSLQALCAAEDETDIQAVKVARAEQKAELAEFDETQPWDEVKTDQEIKKEMEDPTSNVEIELALLDKDASFVFLLQNFSLYNPFLWPAFTCEHRS